MKKQLSALLAAALCAGALAGCGANSNSANAATSGAEDTVTLAVVSPVTGDSAEYGIHFNVGAQMAADKINEAGGINGKQVVLKSFDSKNDAKEAAEVARLICQDKTILATNNDYGLNMLSYMTQEAEADGVVITDTEAIASGEKDFTAIVSKMRQTEPEAVAIMGSYNEVANCVKQIRQVGWDVPVAISGSALTDQLVELLGDDVNGIYSNIAFVASDNTPETKEFNEEFTKRANMPPSFHSISTYDTVMLVCDAAIKCGDNLNRETLKDAIQSYKGFDGLMGPFEFTEDGAVYRGYKVVQYQDGVLTSVSDYMMVHD